MATQRLHFHDLRREAASRKLELAEPWGIHEISIWLGHSNVMTIMRYLAFPSGACIGWSGASKGRGPWTSTI